ncbi:MAG: hypothetical protein H0T89_02210 [Deltaproteobacteria bacterium]|nr:hypothetical protein [Deltaproteobacteria bacterium]
MGAGLAGSATSTAGWLGIELVESKSPLSVWSVPPVIVVEPLTPVSEAVQVLARLLAVKFS